MYIDIITSWFNRYSVLTHEGCHEWTRRTRPLDMHMLCRKSCCAANRLLNSSRYLSHHVRAIAINSLFWLII